MRAILISAALMAACTSSPNYHRAYTPRTVATQLDKDAATQRAVIAITDAGREVESTDAGVVLSKWFSGEGFMSNLTQYRLRVIVAAGSYQIAALCQAHMNEGDPWKQCEDDTKRPQFILDALTKLEAALK
jgi:hypothetical protein